MLRLEFQATRASSWYADAENSFINWEHTIGSPPSFFHQLHVHPRQIISLHVHCQYLSSIRLNIYKLYNCYQALMILAEGCLNWIKEPLIQHTEMTLYQHCWLAIFVMLIWRQYILTSNFWPAGCYEKYTKMEFFGSSWWRFRSSWVKCKWSLNTITILQANTSATHNFEIS